MLPLGTTVGTLSVLLPPLVWRARFIYLFMGVVLQSGSKGRACAPFLCPRWQQPPTNESHQPRPAAPICSSCRSERSRLGQERDFSYVLLGGAVMSIRGTVVLTDNANNIPTTDNARREIFGAIQAICRVVKRLRFVVLFLSTHSNDYSFAVYLC